jgi:hypothetical protein
MSTTSRAHIRKPLRPKRNPWVAQPGVAATVQRYVRPARDLAISSWQAFVPWFNAQSDHRRLAIVAVAFVAMIAVVNVSGVTRLGTTTHVAQTSQTAATVVAPSARILTGEAAPSVPGKAWVAAQLWQGSGGKVTEPFTVGAHWRVDWIFNPPTTGGFLQVFIYSADGALMDVATNTTGVGSDSTFWAGPGTYFLKVNSNAGDWKLDVQDLR